MSVDPTRSNPVLPNWKDPVMKFATVLVALLAASACGTTEPEVETVEVEVVREVEVEVPVVEEVEVEVIREIEVEPADVKERRIQLGVREDEMMIRERDVQEREDEVAALEEALAEREMAVGIIEAEVEANSISGNGVWVVHDQIQPGVYRAQGSGDGCYWARLSSLSGSRNINANHFGSANVTVEISSSDVAFETSGCGSWVRQ